MNKLSILAGNPKVEINEGRIEIDPQLSAFEEAMKVVSTSRNRIEKIGIAFDHKGLFRNQFVDPSLGLSNRRLKHLKLADLRREIISVYEDIAYAYGVSLENISVFSEDVCRAKVVNQLAGRMHPYLLVERGVQCEDTSCNTYNARPESDFKVNCRGITAAIIAGLAINTDEIHTFWSFDPVRVKPATITQGSELAREIFDVRIPIFQNIIWPNGKINTQKIA